MELKHEDGSVVYDNASNTVLFRGRLRSTDPMMFRRLGELLAEADQANRLTMVWDLRDMVYLNSAGLSVLYHFVNRKAQEPGYALKVLANSLVAWQTSSLPNLKTLLPSVQLVFSVPAEEPMKRDA